MTTKILPASNRGKYNNEWLNTRYIYSFAHFFDPNRVGFRNLLVINHDIISAKGGFGEHGHRDMEIITIPLTGMISHKDNIGGIGHIKAGAIQYMSAGLGIVHEEMNITNKPCELLQIWIEPKVLGSKPYYLDQQTSWLENVVLFYKLSGEKII